MVYNYLQLFWHTKKIGVSICIPTTISGYILERRIKWRILRAYFIILKHIFEGLVISFLVKKLLHLYNTVLKAFPMDA